MALKCAFYSHFRAIFIFFIYLYIHTYEGKNVHFRAIFILNKQINILKIFSDFFQIFLKLILK